MLQLKGYIYNIMCSIEAHSREWPTVNDDASSRGGIPLPSSYKNVLVSCGQTPNFIEIWIE